MTPPKRRSFMQNLIIAASLLSLAVCLGAPVLHLLGRLGEADYKAVLLGGTIAWFACATVIAARRRP